MAKKKSFITRLKKYVDGDADTWFEYFILAVIFINVITLGLETTPYGLAHGNVLFIVDQICLWIFVIELLRLCENLSVNSKFSRTVVK